MIVSEKTPAETCDDHLTVSSDAKPGGLVRLRVVVIVVAGLLAAAVPARGQQAAPQLFVTSAVPDAGAGTLTISGGNFTSSGDLGSRPFVTLDLIPLDVRASTDSVILVAVPVGAMPPGKYLLTVSRGSAPADNASLEVTLGTAPPSQIRQAMLSTIRRVPARPRKPLKALADSLPSSVASTGPAAQVGDRRSRLKTRSRVAPFESIQLSAGASAIV